MPFNPFAKEGNKLWTIVEVSPDGRQISAIPPRGDAIKRLEAQNDQVAAVMVGTEKYMAELTIVESRGRLVVCSRGDNLIPVQVPDQNSYPYR